MCRLIVPKLRKQCRLRRRCAAAVEIKEYGLTRGDRYTSTHTSLPPLYNIISQILPRSKQLKQPEQRNNRKP